MDNNYTIINGYLPIRASSGCSVLFQFLIPSQNPLRVTGKLCFACVHPSCLAVLARAHAFSTCQFQYIFLYLARTSLSWRVSTCKCVHLIHFFLWCIVLSTLHYIYIYINTYFIFFTNIRVDWSNDKRTCVE